MQGRREYDYCQQNTKVPLTLNETPVASLDKEEESSQPMERTPPMNETPPLIGTIGGMMITPPVRTRTVAACRVQDSSEAEREFFASDMDASSGCYRSSSEGIESDKTDLSCISVLQDQQRSQHVIHPNRRIEQQQQPTEVFTRKGDTVEAPPTFHLFKHLKQKVKMPPWKDELASCVRLEDNGRLVVTANIGAGSLLAVQQAIICVRGPRLSAILRLAQELHQKADLAGAVRKEFGIGDDIPLNAWTLLKFIRDGVECVGLWSLLLRMDYSKENEESNVRRLFDSNYCLVFAKRDMSAGTRLICHSSPAMQQEALRLNRSRPLGQGWTDKWHVSQPDVQVYFDDDSVSCS